MKPTKILFCLSCFSVLLLAGCSKKDYNSVIETEEYIEMPQSFSSGARMSKSIAADTMIMSDMYAEEAAVEMPDDYNFSRKVIRNGNITIEVPVLDDVEIKLTDFVNKYNGYITNSYANENSYNATIRIPSVYFDEVMNSAECFGKLKYRSQNSQDVTEDFYDLESRISTKKILKEKLESYLADAKDIKDLLEVERQLNSVISELESMEGRMKRLSNQIEYSTIFIDMWLPTGYVDTGYNWPDIGEKFRGFGLNFVNFLSHVLMFLVYLVVFGIPVVLIAAFLFWLLFGRVGLLIKLFRKLKKK